MQLSEVQIEKIYQVLRKKDIHYIDLQDELVDHMATGIEEQMRENPNISFDKALHNEYKKFGVFGFDGLMMDKEDALVKRALYDFIIHFLKFFTIPKLLLTIAIFYFHKYLIEHFSVIIITYVFYVQLTVVMFIGVYWSYFRFKQLRINASKYLYAQRYNKIYHVSFYISYVIYFTPIHEVGGMVLDSPWFVNVLLTVMIIHVLVNYELLKKLEKSFFEKYNSEIA